MDEIYNLEAVVKDALSIFEEDLKRHGMSVDRDFEDLPYPSLDWHKVTMVWMTLISNAAKSMDGAPGSIRVVAKTCDNNRGETTVEEDGMGIRREDLRRIFAHGLTQRFVSSSRSAHVDSRR